MPALIIANGEMEISPLVHQLLHNSELVIAADGGYQNCLRLGIQPHLIIGDLDSIPPGELNTLRKAGLQVIQYPPRKDETDLELALQYAVEQGLHEIAILGALGARWDMSISNILLLAHPAFKGTDIRLVDGTHELMLLQGGGSLALSGHPGEIVSLIPLAGDATGITTLGLEYPLNDETLWFGATRGVSNVFSQEQVEITMRSGFLLCVINHQSGNNDLHSGGK